MHAGLAQQRHGHLVTILVGSAVTRAISRTRVAQLFWRTGLSRTETPSPRKQAAFFRIRGGCTICTGTSGSGCRMSTVRLRESRRPIRQDLINPRPLNWPVTHFRANLSLSRGGVRGRRPRSAVCCAYEGLETKSYRISRVDGVSMNRL